MTEKQNGAKMSRRKFIRNSGLVAGGLVGGGLVGGLIGVNAREGQIAGDGGNGEEQGHNEINHQEAPLYFTNYEMFSVLSDAVERIFPETESGPGAIALGVPFFIDHQLAGAWGYNTREYMQGPFSPGSDYQGYQSPLKRHEVFDVGLQALQTYTRDTYDAGSFVELEEEQKDEVLQAFETNEVELHGVTSNTFFSLLRAATLEGVYADPAYGGNKNMDGWRMKSFPGHQMAYIDQIESEEFVEIEPTGLHAYTD
ncbi:gluconate 2-dehydrogenase subunit 3 family protein [Shouchella shacheensis]|uniref:gluconate 2-dehydrogenase subunit 3 family protein n=1 Tax=Shouchella shacheensis TaxID=1649580 RepID=UPI00074053A4|nr:gluconate 2-dehydrogenase subunit 3 family protein [Shouchella shacheensis]